MRITGIIAGLLAAALIAGGCAYLSDRAVSLCETAELDAKRFQSGEITLSDLEASWNACKDAIRLDFEDGSFVSRVLERLRAILQDYLDDLLLAIAAPTRAEAYADDRVQRVTKVLEDIKALQQ